MSGAPSPVTTLSTGDYVDPISPAGAVYQAMVDSLLKAEYERRKTLEGRGATLLTASASMLTLIFALTVFVTGKDHVFANRCAVTYLVRACRLRPICADRHLRPDVGIQVQTAESGNVAESRGNR
jgi:hypothetical protein